MEKASERDGLLFKGLLMVYLGIDVSKAKLPSCLLLDGKGKCKTKVVENSPAGVTALRAWAPGKGSLPSHCTS
jgi:hypothetical protein